MRIFMNADVGNSTKRHKNSAINDEITRFVIVPVTRVVLVTYNMMPLSMATIRSTAK